VIDANIVQVLVQLMTAAEHEVRKEAVWAISNATSGGSPDQIDFLVRCGAVAALAEMLRAAMERDSRILVVAMEGVENILKAGEAKYGPSENPFIGFCEEADIPGVLELLQDVEDKGASWVGVAATALAEARPRMHTH
jgi:importin subunit alpha-6/7